MTETNKDEKLKDAVGQSELNDWVRCVGVDSTQHVCLPWENASKCGMRIKRKKLLPDDYKLPSCYECTY